MFDDKDLVIICATIIALASMWMMKDATIISNVVTGLFGVAIGKQLKEV